MLLTTQAVAHGAVAISLWVREQNMLISLSHQNNPATIDHDNFCRVFFIGENKKSL